VVLKVSKILVSLGASVNPSLATGRERYGHFRSGRDGCAPIQSDGAALRPRSVIVVLSIAKVANKMPRG
jgi:hypothetical protein